MDLGCEAYFGFQPRFLSRALSIVRCVHVGSTSYSLQIVQKREQDARSKREREKLFGHPNFKLSPSLPSPEREREEREERESGEPDSPS